MSLIAALPIPSGWAADNNTPARRESAEDQFDKAESNRKALEAKPENSRTLKDYSALVEAYRRVYLITPHATDVPSALNEVAELYRSMGDLFSEKYYQQSVDAFQFLMRQYPESPYNESAMLAVARLEQDDLHNNDLARKAFQDFLAQHPRSRHIAEARAAIDRMNAPNSPNASPIVPVKPALSASLKDQKDKDQKDKDRADGEQREKGQGDKDQRDQTGRAAVKTVSVDKTTPPSTDTRQGMKGDPSAPSGSGPHVTRIRTWNADNYTRIVIDVGAQVKYQAARITNPDRIYFDIEGTKIDSVLLHKSIDVADGGFLKAIRVAQNQSGVARVVLEVNRVKDYSVFLLPDPYRLIVDVYGTAEGAQSAALATAPAPGPLTDSDAAKSNAVPAASDAIAKSAAKPSAKAATKASADATDNADISVNGIATATPIPNAPLPAKDPAGNLASKKNAAKGSSKPSGRASTSASAKAADNSDDASGADGNALSASAAIGSPEPAAQAEPAVVRTPLTKGASRVTESAHDQAIEMGPASMPEPTRDGQRSLTRALGLKIGRIVIDPGHGGHDTGTIGPTGLMEKDLCLDVSLRLGKLIEQHLPATEVVYTRDDDTFIPLEHRTEIANDAHADLFLSVHANSSSDHKARGIETYYLNFTASSDAMEVAARENAFSGNGVHDLQDLVTKIARNEKIEESRDFAGLIQDSLTKHMDGINHGDRNRGVRKAPFVVLIGADMPSVLAEISFISNPNDEQWLKKPENRQRVAEGLYRGIESYLQNTNSLANNQSNPAPGSRSTVVARSGNSQ